MLDASVSQLLATAAGLDRVILASDFDGTLAGFHNDPMAVRPAPGTMEALRAATELAGTTVALVSGRDLATLATLSGVEPEEEIVLIGSHGAETSYASAGASAAGAILDEELTALLTRIQRDLEAICTRYPGAWVEHKMAARALHTRPLTQQDSDAALAEAMALAAERYPQVHVMTGKCVVELPVLEASKGTALNLLLDAVSAQAVVYLGDDVTDERAFQALNPGRGDVTIKVGAGETAAIARVPDIEDVRACLELFVDSRRQHLA